MTYDVVVFEDGFAAVVNEAPLFVGSFDNPEEATAFANEHVDNGYFIETFYNDEPVLAWPKNH